MKNLLVEVSYRGTAYHGFQFQKNALSIAEVLQDKIEQVLRKREPIVGCSRTDAGVHANSCFFHMKTDVPFPTEKFPEVLNRVLPPDIVVLSCKEVPLDFHARYSCKGKEYWYRVWNHPVKDPFLSDLALFHKKPIDVELLNGEALPLIGTHDFTSFCNPNHKEGMSTIRTVDRICLTREGDMVTMAIHADGFLYNMVRIIMGTLLEINDGMLPQNSVLSILEAKDRSRAGRTAPPHGLYLNRVDY